MKTLMQRYHKNLFITAVLMIFSLSILLSSVGCSIGANRIYQEGEKLLQEGKLDEASVKFSTYIKKKPKDPKGYTALADVLNTQALMTEKTTDRNQLMDKSFGVLQKAKEKAPESEIPNIGMGKFYLTTGQVEKAKEEFVEAQKKNPENLVPKYLLGLIYAGEKDYKKSEEIFKEIIKTAPKKDDEHGKALAVAYAGLIEFIGMKARTDEESFKIIEEALAFNPEYSRAYAVRGIYYYKSGKIENAIKDFETAIQKSADGESFSHKILGKIYEKKGDRAKAIQHYEAFVESFSRDTKDGIPDGRDAIKEKDLSRIKAYTGIDPGFRDLKAVREKVKRLKSEE
jgi:tetratricopeptide (TPR) repeat protein